MASAEDKFNEEQFKYGQIKKKSIRVPLNWGKKQTKHKRFSLTIGAHCTLTSTQLWASCYLNK